GVIEHQKITMTHPTVKGHRPLDPVQGVGVIGYLELDVARTSGVDYQGPARGLHDDCVIARAGVERGDRTEWRAGDGIGRGTAATAYRQEVDVVGAVVDGPHSGLGDAGRAEG